MAAQSIDDAGFAAVAAFAQVARAIPARSPDGVSLAGVAEDVQAAWGRVPDARWRQVAAAAVAVVVGPCAVRMLDVATTSMVRCTAVR